MNSSVPVTQSKNPFLHSPNSNNPFRRRPSEARDGRSSSPDASVIDAAERYPQLPPEPPAGALQSTVIQPPPIPSHPTGMVLTPMPPVVPTQVPLPAPMSPPALPARRPTQPVPAELATPSTSQRPQQQPILEVNDEPMRNPDNMTDDEALEAAIQASLRDGPTYSAPSGPPPGRSVSSPSTPQPTRRSSPPPRVEPQPTGASSTPSNPPPPFELEPPPYTPSPDVFSETTVEVGPRRPFQNAAQAPPRRVPGGYPGSVSRQRTGAGSADLGNSWRADVTIPASNSGPYLTPQGTGWSARSSSQPDLTLLDTTSGSSYAPPTGPPPQRNPSQSSPARNTEASEDDGKPTVQPTPGRPLLNNGKTLVYPPGYFCHKCWNLTPAVFLTGVIAGNNTGYKSFDPTHPCSKCWQKYSRPYSGPLTYAPWANRPADTNFQRPLPRTFGPSSTALSLQRGQSSARPSWSAGPGESYRSSSSNNLWHTPQQRPTRAINCE
ncbi:hypothetical protein FRB90_012262 [Tulasnella sp. 427]|nr:hypothetical protein FRB90_012262 [Tulasnella sp. 427]